MLAHTQFGGPVKHKDHLHPFQLDLHLREILLHGGVGSRQDMSLRSWPDTVALHNSILRGVDVFFQPGEVMLELHRLTQQQLPHFDSPDMHFIGRYWALYRHPKVAALIEKAFGLTALEYFVFVSLLWWRFMQSPSGNPQAEIAPLGLSAEAVRQRIAAITTTQREIRDQLISAQRFSPEWAYTFNAITERPLVQCADSPKGVLHCPSPDALIRRVLGGLYFDLVRVPGFSEAFGEAVDETTGEFFRKSAPSLHVFKPVPYGHTKGIRHGADWVVCDQTAKIFVECKTARLPLKSRVAATAADVEDGMNRLSDAIVQNYQNISDYQSGLTGMEQDGTPIYNLVVTSEDWVIFSRDAVDALQRQVSNKLLKKGLRAELIDEVPWNITPLRDVPLLGYSISTHSIEAVLSRKSEEDYPRYMMNVYLDSAGWSKGAPSDFFTPYFEELFDEIRVRGGVANDPISQEN